MLAQSKQAFSHVISIDTFNQLSLTQLASIYEKEGNTPKAVKYYTQLIKYYPDNAIYNRKLAQNYAKAGAIIDAFRHYNAAHKLNPNDIFSIKGISEIFLQNQQYEDADILLNKGLTLDTTNIDLHQLLARSKYKQKDYDSTIYYLKQINGRVDLSPYFNKLLGYSLIQIDSFEQSIFYLQKALSDNGNKEYVHYYLATAYDNLDDELNSEHHYTKALEEGISPNIAIYHKSLAKINNDRNKLREAIDHYRDAYRYDEDPVLLFYLGRASDVYYKDKNIAVNYYKRYTKSSHDNDEYKRYALSRANTLLEFIHQSK